jgi:hypothetical protein
MRSSDLAAPEFFVTTESWLNAKAGPSERGYVFSIYMVGTFVAIALGQLLISRVEIGTTTPFNIIVVLFAAALVLVSTTRADQLHAVAIPYLTYGQMTRAAPVSVGGAGKWSCQILAQPVAPKS